MPNSDANSLSDYLSHQAGDAVQSVVSYDEDGFEILHVREDLSETDTEDRLEDIANVLRDQHRRDRAEQTFELGDFHCSLLGFEEGIVLHFPQDENKGTVIAMDARVAQQFNEFVSECAERIYGD